MDSTFYGREDGVLIDGETPGREVRYHAHPGKKPALILWQTTDRETWGAKAILDAAGLLRLGEAAGGAVMAAKADPP